MEKNIGVESVFDTLITTCINGGDVFGNILLDYQKINIEVLMMYMNMAFCGTSNIRFKEKMFCEKLSDAVTISEEAFAVLVFENCFKRWIYLVEKETNKNQTEENRGEDDTNLDDDDEDRYVSKTPGMLYQKNFYRKKDKKETAGKWTDDGFRRYNELLSMVRESRNSNWRTSFEDELQKRYIERADGKLKLYKKRMKLKEDMLKPKRPKVAPENMLDIMAL